MRSPFRTALYPQERGHPGEEWNIAVQPDLDDPNYPDEPGHDNRAIMWEAGVTDMYQDSSPGNAGQLVMQHNAAPGPTDAHSFLNPAVGSTDLSMPRDVGSMPGVNRSVFAATGPVTGMTTDVYTGVRAVPPSRTPGQVGPVTGGPDQSQMAMRAYFQQQAALYSQQYSDAAMLAAV